MSRHPIPLNPPAVVREVEDLAALAAEINAEHDAGEEARKGRLEHYRRAGAALLRAKQACGHGEWKKWLAEPSTGWSSVGRALRAGRRNGVSLSAGSSSWRRLPKAPGAECIRRATVASGNTPALKSRSKRRKPSAISPRLPDEKIYCYLLTPAYLGAIMLV